MADELTAAELEALDPAPDVHALFAHYNQLYFDNCLGACSVEWSTKRMTLCAGVCHFQRGGGCRIKLSEPLLKFRPTRDLKDTLLHEMIHAELFLKGVRDDGDHGHVFRARMEAINKATFADTCRPAGGYNITVFHTMHDEVAVYRTHVWSCSRCGNTVKRAMNRPPQEADCRSYTKAAAAAAAAAGAPGAYCADVRCWYHNHVKHCGGQYVKVQEPDKPSKQQQTKNGATTTSSSGGVGSITGSSKRPKKPAAATAATAAAVGMQPISSFFHTEPQKQQQQQQQPQRNQDRPRLAPLVQQQQQQWQQQTRPSQEDKGEQQQQQQHGPLETYWSRLGRGRVLGGSSGGSSGSQQQVRVQAAVGGAASIQHKQQQLFSNRLLQPAQQQQHRQQEQQPELTQQQRQKQQQKQQQWPSCGQPTSQRVADVVELLSSDDEEGAGGGDFGDSGGAVVTPSAAAAVGSDDGSAGVLSCPVCCEEWLPGQISNAELNAHLDDCLGRMHC